MVDKYMFIVRCLTICVCFLCRVKAFEDKLNGYNKEVEAFRKKEARHCISFIAVYLKLT